jgi:hypothetical protein
MEGQWKVKVITEEELVIGIVDFEVMNVSDSYTSKTIEKSF